MNAARKIFAITAFIFIALVSTAQAQAEKIENVKVRFRNNSIVFRKVTIITYFPIKTGNSTTGMVLAPYFSTAKEYMVGTKIYFADRKQIDTVMGGNRLEGKPFLVIKAEDEGKTFDIFE